MLTMSRKKRAKAAPKVQATIKVEREVRDYWIESMDAPDRARAWVLICALLDDPQLPDEAKLFIRAKANELYDRIVHGLDVDPKGLGKEMAGFLHGGK